MQFFRWGAVESRTDHSIDDEPAGKERARQAAASEARRQREAAESQARNALNRERLGRVGAATDSDITDEAAGKARVELAAASKAKRVEEARTLARENAMLRSRRSEKQLGAPKTDVDLTDEEAWQRRIELASESKARHSNGLLGQRPS